MPGKKPIPGKAAPTKSVTSGVAYTTRGELLLRMYDLLLDLEEFSMRDSERTKPNGPHSTPRQQLAYMDSTGDLDSLRVMYETHILPVWRQRKEHRAEHAAIHKMFRQYVNGIVLQGEVERLIAWEYTISYEAAGAMFDGMVEGFEAGKIEGINIGKGMSNG